MNEIECVAGVCSARERVVGRFAPSPTGDLHMGSLMAAVASFLAARSCGGRWLVRIEDVDRPREVVGAAARILFDLERFGFEWDGPVWFQSTRNERYRYALDRLIKAGHAYPCACSRREIQLTGLTAIDGYRYDGRCRTGLPAGRKALAWRLRVPDEQVAYLDGIQGVQSQNLANDVGDFVLLRADGCWTYQLAVVVDDAEQGVNQVVRGADLLDSTPRQIWVQRLLGYIEPQYMHIPVIANSRGEKLSKQTLAPALLKGGEAKQLWMALYLLWQSPPLDLRNATINEVWQWALLHWSVNGMPQKRAVSVEIDRSLAYTFLKTNK
ncbi:MAG: tRNA glutamyl-Q(34) synthetase GluQRS [Formivibrio sp.]|nr:tRNA glutamyl-Q(34) synthetase GluQRS [Formivibrio sp.]